MPVLRVIKPALLVLCLLCCQQLLAHYGKIAYAYPIGKITIDGNFSDWPQTAVKYKLGYNASDTRPDNDADLSGFFQLGYRLDNQSLYIAFTITDNDFVEDTSASVSWNTQDGLEVSIDGRHLPIGSGVASFMYSKKLRNTNHAYFDAFAKNISWKNIEVAMVRKGNVSYYEWRITVGDHLQVGKSIGLEHPLLSAMREFLVEGKRVAAAP